MLCRPDGWDALGQDDIHLEANKLGCQRGQSRLLPLRRAVLQGDTLTLHIPEVAESLAEDLEDGMGDRGSEAQGSRIPIRGIFATDCARDGDGAQSIPKARASMSPMVLRRMVESSSIPTRARLTGDE